MMYSTSNIVDYIYYCMCLPLLPVCQLAEKVIIMMLHNISILKPSVWEFTLN